MKIKSSFFNELEFDKKDVILLEKGLVGMPDLNRFVLMDFSNDSVLHWLQSVDNPNVGFIVSEPNLFHEEYAIAIDPETKKELQIEDEDEMVVMVIVTVKDHGEKITANLLGPVIVNAAKHVGCQLILDSKSYQYSTETPLRKVREDSKIGVTA